MYKKDNLVLTTVSGLVAVLHRLHKNIPLSNYFKINASDGI